MNPREYLVVEAFAEVASYRIPEYHNFHKTLPLPPPTAIVGMAGAALGLSPSDAQVFFDESDVEIGIQGTYQGIYSDLWKIESTKRGTESSVLKREYLFNNKYMFVFGAGEAVINALNEAFGRNYYALTAGNSDSLMKICACAIYPQLAIKDIGSVEHCVLHGDLRSSMRIGLDDLIPNNIYRYSTIISPVTYNVPYAFDYPDDEPRSIRFRQELTFVGTRAELTGGMTVPAIIHNDVSIPVFTYSKYAISGKTG
ncbi:MAG: CRISPR-associated protein Cas5 [Candidatus Cloacimonadaceae bacterium]|nr:CRISPR-associated protein Cas5 [Candidatus Cloacimonadaceae bacterium]MDP3115106.1 CRISPR-associated protein Cas5 [Candidatus Cloacimonadaceae bacterium]